ncbi:ATP-binding cassette domain-containing protein [Bacillus licheniformis]|nr:ATP-binding cassette domain-containing protein [Bacillus licheniformis]
MGRHRFSGGQWQRIALARSFMKDAGLVILDEPAASLDIRAEYDISGSFKASQRENGDHDFPSVQYGKDG